ncbi:MAG: glycerate kinase [Bacteroidaceae bacterium]|nr:glycerate kinase [Bacteroidaceae bacterium]
MNILVAIDSLKGCLSSAEANEAAREGLLRTWPEAEVVTRRVSDGGEGWLDAFGGVGASPEDAPLPGFESVDVEVCDPLMRPVRAQYLRQGTLAVVEVARACGLGLLRPEERNPLRASTYGVGQLIVDAWQRGCTHFVVGLGGSGTSDAGRGMLQACRDNGLLLGDMPQVPLSFVLATDVSNPLCGPQGAAAVFAPQKGADTEMVRQLEQQSLQFARENAGRMGLDRSAEAGAGAAGGLGYAFMQFFGAECRSGAEVLMETMCFDALLARADLVITGEGGADRQTLMGKLPCRILCHAKAAAVPCLLIAGNVADREELLSAGFADVICFNPPELPRSEALRPVVAKRQIAETCSRFRFIPFP